MFCKKLVYSLSFQSTGVAEFTNSKLVSDDSDNTCHKHSALSLSNVLSVTISLNVFNDELFNNTPNFLYAYKGTVRIGQTFFFHQAQQKHNHGRQRRHPPMTVRHKQVELVGFSSSPMIKIVASVIDSLSPSLCSNCFSLAIMLATEPIYENYPDLWSRYIPLSVYKAAVLFEKAGFWLDPVLFNIDITIFMFMKQINLLH